MYNLLIKADKNHDYWGKNQTHSVYLDYFFDRIFEYTDEDIEKKYKSPGGHPDFDALKKLPCLFTYEATDIIGTIGYFQWVGRGLGTARGIYGTYTLLDGYPKIDMNEDQIFHDLGIIEKFEQHRTHWAVKNIDLFQFTTKMIFDKFLCRC